MQKKKYIIDTHHSVHGIHIKIKYKAYDGDKGVSKETTDTYMDTPKDTDITKLNQQVQAKCIPVSLFYTNTE